ncbi:MAG: DUF502 domain-containing protein [Candidatus Melainabacteria bacterium]|nr:DUF502 domain-containing protein [Candidatus Melainabacteria bacterium]
MKKYFFTGFITLLPIALTIMIALWLLNMFTAPLAGITEYVILTYEKQLGLSLQHHDTLVLILSRSLAFVVLIVMIFLLGLCGRWFLTNIFSKLFDRLFSHIPMMGPIYRMSKDVTKAMFTEDKKTFKETVLVPFPHDQALAIGFMTSETPEIFKNSQHPTDLAIFVPTSPHPMSGFVLLTPRKMVIPVDVPVEDAFKFIISCGVIHPGEPVPSEEKKK